MVIRAIQDALKNAANRGQETENQKLSSPEFIEIYLHLSKKTSNVSKLLDQITSIDTSYKKLSPELKDVYWKLVINKLDLQDLIGAFTELNRVISSYNYLTSTNNPSHEYYLSISNFFNPDNLPERSADSKILTVRHVDEIENLKRDSVNNPQSLRILENYKIISNARFGLNSVQVLEEAKLWGRIIEENTDIPEAIVFQILSDLRILPSGLKPHLDAYKKLGNLDGYSKELIAEKDNIISSPDFKSDYLYLLMFLQAKHDLRTKEYKEVYIDNASDITFDSEAFALRELRHLPPQIVKSEILAAKTLYDYLKNQNISDSIKNQIRLILESGSNFEYGLLKIQSTISSYESFRVPFDQINRLMRVSPNMDLDKRAVIVNSLRSIEALPNLIKSEVKKFLRRDNLNAAEVYNEALLLIKLLVSCYEPIPNILRRNQLMTLLAWNLKPSEIKDRLGL